MTCCNGGTAFFLKDLPHQRVNDGLKLALADGVGKDQCPHGFSVHSAIGGNQLFAKFSQDTRNGSSPRQGQGSGNGIGVHDGGARTGHDAGGRALAAANAARQPQSKWLAAQRVKPPWKCLKRNMRIQKRLKKVQKRSAHCDPVAPAFFG